MKLQDITAIIFDLGGTLFRPVTDMCGLTRDFLSDSGHGERGDFSDEAIVSATKEPDEWLDREEALCLELSDNEQGERPVVNFTDWTDEELVQMKEWMVEETKADNVVTHERR